MFDRQRSNERSTLEIPLTPHASCEAIENAATIPVATAVRRLSRNAANAVPLAVATGIGDFFQTNRATTVELSTAVLVLFNAMLSWDLRNPAFGAVNLSVRFSIYAAIGALINNDHVMNLVANYAVGGAIFGAFFGFVLNALRRGEPRLEDDEERRLNREDHAEFMRLFRSDRLSLEPWLKHRWCWRWWTTSMTEAAFLFTSMTYAEVVAKPITSLNERDKFSTFNLGFLVAEIGIHMLRIFLPLLVRHARQYRAFNLISDSLFGGPSSLFARSTQEVPPQADQATEGYTRYETDSDEENPPQQAHMERNASSHSDSGTGANATSHAIEDTAHTDSAGNGTENPIIPENSIVAYI